MMKIKIMIAAFISVAAGLYAGGRLDSPLGNNTYEYDIDGFSGIDGSSAFDIEVRQSNKFSVLIVADEEQKKKLIVEKRGDDLYLGMKPFPGFFNKTPKAIITMPRLDRVDLSGAAQMIAAGFSSDRDFSSRLSGASSLEIDITAADIVFDLSGSSDITAVLDGKRINIELSGASDIKLTGRGRDLSVDAGGASTGDLEDFLVGDADVQLSGSSDFHINLKGTLNIDASGASTLYYTGNVILGNIELSGASAVKEE